MGKDHCHGEPYKIPDYREYKVEDIPLLVRTQQALAAQGLRDPWLRNEVWRYNPNVFGSEKKRLRLVFFRGFPIGVAAFVLSVIGTEVYKRVYPPQHGHHEKGKEDEC